jgi:hypothetical protein
MSEHRASIAIAVTLIIMAVALRLVPHPANFAPVAAVSLFGGAVLPRKFALWVPLAAMVISDMVISFYDIMPVIWCCYLLIALASSFWLKPASAIRLAVLTLSASIFFFVVSNFAVWVASSMYDHTLAGLTQCYAMALPFFRNTFLSDALYTTALFSMFAVARKTVSKSLHVVRQS